MIRQQLQRLRNRVDRLRRPGGRGLILLYHRVAEDESDPYGLCVSPEHFKRHLEAVRQVGTPMSVRDMARAARESRLPDRAIAITFDDGYLDNYDIAVPLLQRYDVPATIFVTTGEGGRSREFWWDELERIFFVPEELPDELEIAINGEARRWSIGPDARYDGGARQRVRTWHLLDRDAPTARHAAFRETYFLLQPLDAVARRRVLDSLQAWSALEGTPVRDSRRVVSPEQVAELAGGGLIEIGAHTVDHPSLPAQTAEAREHEITESKAELERWIGRPVAGFAYPYGLYDQASIDVVRSAGFEFACAGDHRAVWKGDDPHLLPRVDVPPGSGDAVSRLLHRFLA